MAAARCTADRAIADYPYYRLRYGHRGELFGRSDSGYLTVIAHVEYPRARERVFWLGELLSQRGMPRWLLERHLETLHAELCAAVPERRERYAVLPRLVAELIAERRAHTPAANWDALVSAFHQETDPHWGERLPEAPALLLSAVADERAGIDGAFGALWNWLVDPARFGADWISAMRRLRSRAES